MTAADASASTFDRLLALGGKALDNPVAIGKVIDGMAEVARAMRDIAQARVEQERIQAEAQGEIARIHTVRDAMLTYLDRSFDERKQNFARLFDALDQSIASGEIDMVAKTLDAVVALAAESPFKALADAATAARVLKEKDHEWEL